MKKYIKTLAFLIFGFFWVSYVYAQQETVYTAKQLFSQAKRSLEKGDWRRAELLLFALIQKNSDQYLSDKAFRDDLDRGLRDARERNRPAQSSGRSDEGPYLPYATQLLEGNESSVRFMSGVYKHEVNGDTYEITRIGSDVWWKSTSNPKWHSVMHGKIVGDEIQGQWTFIPWRGRNTNGMIKLKIRGPGAFVVQEVSGMIQAIGGMERGTTWFSH